MPVAPKGAAGSRLHWREPVVDLGTAGMAYLRPWILGAIGWLFLSLPILLEYRSLPDSAYLRELWLLLSLLWLEFPFAGIYGCLRRGRYRQVPGLVLTALAAPALLHFLVFFVIG